MSSFLLIARWFKRNYFSGDLNLHYCVVAAEQWLDIRSSFEAEFRTIDSENELFYYGFSEDSIVITQDANTGFRNPNDTSHITTEIWPENGNYTVNIQVASSGLYSTFFQIFKFGTFLFTLAWLLAFIVRFSASLFNWSDFIPVVILGVFNCICWMVTANQSIEIQRMVKLIDRIFYKINTDSSDNTKDGPFK